MQLLLYWLFVIAVIPLTAFAVSLLVNKMADNDVFFTKLSEGEIIVVMDSDIKSRFIGRMEGYWVHPKSGKVWKNGEGDIGSETLPSQIFGMYWLGMWPFARVYTYRFHWNKYMKQDGDEKYGIIPRDEIVSSIYFQASYPVRIVGAETIEGVPLTLDFLYMTQTTNADTALFKIKSPGWLAAETAAFTAITRDFIGSKQVTDITRLKVEVPDSGEKSEFQEMIESLNNPGVGNPSIDESFGQKIVSVNFIGYSIDTPTNDLQRASIAKYMAERESDKVIAAQAGELAKIATGVKKIKDEGEARGNALKSEAEGLLKQREALKDCPEMVGMAMARAIEKQETATTLMIGQSVMPTIPVK